MIICKHSVGNQTYITNNFDIVLILNKEKCARKKNFDIFVIPFYNTYSVSALYRLLNITHKLQHWHANKIKVEK